jgi:hypothetical protein
MGVFGAIIVSPGENTMVGVGLMGTVRVAVVAQASLASGLNK